MGTGLPEALRAFAWKVGASWRFLNSWEFMMEQLANDAAPRTPWNKGKLVGQKAPLKLKEIWAIRIRLQLEHRARELALFNLAIDSKLRGCDLVRHQSARCLPRDPRCLPCDRDAAKDAAARAVQNHACYS